MCYPPLPDWGAQGSAHLVFVFSAKPGAVAGDSRTPPCSWGFGSMTTTACIV